MLGANWLPAIKSNEEDISMKKIKFLLATIFTIMMLSTANANMIVNGSFETPDISTGSWSIFPSIPSWITTFGGGIEIQDHVAASPLDGNQHVELDRWNNSGMSQQITTIGGQSYLLSFAYSPRPGVFISSNGIEVFFNSILLDSISVNGIGLPDTIWAIFNYPVTATSALSLLEFRATGQSDSYGGYIDNVQFNQATTVVPEPSTLLLLVTSPGLRSCRAGSGLERNSRFKIQDSKL